MLTQAGVRTALAKRLGWGRLPKTASGWVTVGVDVAGDVRDGLAIADGSIEYAVAMHALPEVAYPDLGAVLTELRRVLVPGGVLRIGVADLDRAIAAYVEGDRDYFDVPDADAACIGAKLVARIVGHGSVRTPFTFEFAAEQLDRAGFRDVVRCDRGQTASAFPDIVALDDGDHETLFLEAVR